MKLRTLMVGFSMLALAACSLQLPDGTTKEPYLADKPTPAEAYVPGDQPPPGPTS